MEIAILCGIGFLGGVVGSVLGVGGGFIIVPLLTLVLDLPMQVIIATSLLSILATSSTAAAHYIKLGFTNIRLAMFLEVATIIGAVSCAFLAVRLTSAVLNVLFACLLVYAGYNMARRRHGAVKSYPDTESTEDDTSEGEVLLAGSFWDASMGKIVHYRGEKLSGGMGAGFLAGALSGLLGIGGGIVQVPAMNLLMRLPIKVVIGTSSFIMGITALGGALVYCLHGYVYPIVAAPVVIGAFLGSRVGSRITPRVRGVTLERMFAALMIIAAAVMILRILGGTS